MEHLNLEQREALADAIFEDWGPTPEVIEWSREIAKVTADRLAPVVAQMLADERERIALELHELAQTAVNADMPARARRAAYLNAARIARSQP